MDLIAAQGEQSRKAAMRQLTGGASSFIRKAADELYAIQAGVAACIDYPEEISEEEAASDLAPRIAHLAKTLTDACDERAARLLQSGLRVALCGQPNVGKSSLLNALLGEEKAIVTAIPGTTRDLVEGTLMLSGSVIHLTDTAGLHDTDDPVERIGVDRARRALADADVVLLVLDMSRPLTNEDESLLRTLHGRTGCIVLNKSDLPPVLTESDLQDAADGKPILTVSASVPDSLQPLKSYLASQAAVSDQLTLTQPRHIAAARRRLPRCIRRRKRFAAIRWTWRAWICSRRRWRWRKSRATRWRKSCSMKCSAGSAWENKQNRQVHRANGCTCLFIYFRSITVWLSLTPGVVGSITTPRVLSRDSSAAPSCITCSCATVVSMPNKSIRLNTNVQTTASSVVSQTLLWKRSDQLIFMQSSFLCKSFSSRWKKNGRKSVLFTSRWG